jgi:hypothetical protein
VIGGHSANVCIVALAWLCLIAGCAGPSWSATPSPQEKDKQPEAAEPQAADSAQPIDLSDEVVRDV